MAGNRKFGTFVALIFVVVGAWLLQRWTMAPEIIRINGQAITVIDGDSFKSLTDEFRIYGIDAPEFRQNCEDANGNGWPCGREAKKHLSRLLERSDYQCEIRARDRFGRAVVSCHDVQDSDLGSAMVAQGWAVSDLEFDQVIYSREESAAKESNLGLWKGTFQHPKEWRENNPRRSK